MHHVSIWHLKLNKLLKLVSSAAAAASGIIQVKSAITNLISVTPHEFLIPTGAKQYTQTLTITNNMKIAAPLKWTHLPGVAISLEGNCKTRLVVLFISALRAEAATVPEYVTNSDTILSSCCVPRCCNPLCCCGKEIAIARSVGY
jgi:hypothetical protein